MHQLKHDIENRAQEKLASLANYMEPALMGGALLTGASVIPALLNAYANEGDPLKTLASTAQYTVPLGMLLGAGSVPAGKLTRMFTETLPESISALTNKIPNMADAISPAALQKILANSPAFRGIADTAAPFVDDTVAMVKDLGREAVRTGVDTARLFV